MRGVSKILNKVDEKSWFSLIHTYLAAPELMAEMVKSTLHLVENDAFYFPLQQMLTLEATNTLSPAAISANYADWANPVLLGSETASASSAATVLGPLAPAQTGETRLADLSRMLGEKGGSFLGNLLKNLLNKIGSLEKSERTEVLYRLTENGENSFFEQANPLRLGLALVSQLDQTKLIAIDDLIEGVKEAIEEARGEEVSGDALLPVHAKIGSSIVRDVIEKLLIKGGEIGGCAGLRLPGLKELAFELQERAKANGGITGANSKASKDWYEVLALYFTPNAACEGAPPIAKHIFTYLDKALNCPATSGGNEIGRDDPKRSCFNDEEKRKIAKDLTQYNRLNSHLFQFTGNAAVYRKLLMEIFDEKAQELAQDPYALYWEHFARGKVSIQDWTRLRQFAESAGIDSAESIAQTEEQIEANPSFKKIFGPNLLANLIQKKISVLQLREEEFGDMAQKYADEKITRVLLGLYAGGPVEQFFQKNLTLDNLPRFGIGLPTAPQARMRVNEILYRMKTTYGLLGDQNWDIFDNSLEVRPMGVAANFVAMKNGNLELGVETKPQGLSDLFPVSQRKSLLRMSNLLDYGSLVAINIDQPVNANGQFTHQGFGGTENCGDSETECFRFWIQGDKKRALEGEFLTKIYNYNTWAGLVPAVNKSGNHTPSQFKGENAEFFESRKPYTMKERRQIFYHLSSSFLVGMGNVPAADSFRFGAKLMDSMPLYGMPYYRYQQNNKKWSTLLEHFPEDFFAPLDGKLSRESEEGTTAERLKEIYRPEWWKMTAKDDGIFDWDNNLDKNLDKNIGNKEGNYRYIKRLALLNLLTLNDKIRSSGRNYSTFMPAIGLANSCWDKRGKPVDCPLTMQGANALPALWDYLDKALYAHFCPFVPGAGSFEPALLTEISRELGINTNGELVRFCQTEFKNLLTEKESELWPRTFLEQSIKDVLNLGKNPKVRKELVVLPQQIALHRLSLATVKGHMLRPESVVSEWLNLPHPVNAMLTKNYVKKSSDHKGFNSFTSGLPNMLIGGMVQSMKRSGDFVNITRNILRVLGEVPYENGVPQHPAPEKGIFYEIYNEIVYQPYLQEKNSSISVLEFVLRSLTRLANHPRYHESLGRLTAYPEDMEGLGVWADTFPSVLEVVENRITDRGDVFSWQRPEMKLFKNILRQANVRVTGDIFHNFSARESADGIRSLLEILQKAGPEENLYPVVKSLVKFFEGQGVAVNGQQALTVASTEKSLQEIMLKGKLLEITPELASNLEQMTLPHKGFDGKMHTSPASTIATLINVALEELPKIFQIYQNAVATLPMPKFDSASSNKKTYFQNLLITGTKPLQKNPQAGPIAAKLFESAGLGEWETSFLPFLTDEKLIAKEDKALTVLNLANRQIYKEAILENELLFPGIHNTLHYFVTRAKWSANFSFDLKELFESLGRLSAPGNVKWAQQNQLLQKWFNN
jgi:hypothetical protein